MNVEIVQSLVAALSGRVGPQADETESESPLALAAGVRAAFVFALVVMTAVLVLGAFASFIEVDSAGLVSCVPARAACA